MKVLSISELTQFIKKELETRLGSLSVQGEISNVKIQSSGHIYFTLKDSQAQISAVLFKGAADRLSRPHKEGDQVLAKGEISVYPPRGSYQLLVRELQYQGAGALLVKLHELKKQMQEKGYFDKARKKKLPSHPKTIGVITSPTGAVIQDIIQVLQRRHAGFHLILNPVKVQGEGAKEEIAKAIDQFNRYRLADVLIVGRGGGSLEDLWAFNEEIVVEAIVRSNIPTISAVGHETDFCLSDFAADVRAPTPSAAAEIVLAEKQQQLQFLLQTKKRLHSHCSSLLSSHKKRFYSLQKNPYISSPYLLLSKKMQQTDEVKNRLELAIHSLLHQKKLRLESLQKQNHLLQPSYRIQLAKERCQLAQKRLHQMLKSKLDAQKARFDVQELHRKFLLLIHQSLDQRKKNLDNLTSHLHSINPKNLLTKGYCILFS